MKDANWLKSQFPFPLVPTNMEGVYTTAPLPADLDLKTASDATLWQHGLLLKRPKPDDHPVAVAAWDQIAERGLRTVVPQLGPLHHAVHYNKKFPQPKPPGLTKPPAVSNNWCGGVLEGAGNWSGVSGIISLPYLSVPSTGLGGNQPAGLSAWVGLDGWTNNNYALFQTVIFINLDTTTNPPSTLFGPVNWQWYIPDPNEPTMADDVFGEAVVTNAPAMKSGDLVRLSCSYVTASDGSNWGAVSFLFYDDLETFVVPNYIVNPAQPGVKQSPKRTIKLPILINLFIQGPPSLSGSGASIEWILENEAVTNTPSGGNVMPVFSGSSNSVTPVTFTQAVGYAGQSPTPTGDPVNGLAVVLGNNAGKNLNIVTVALASETVSITYTGPT